VTAYKVIIVGKSLTDKKNVRFTQDTSEWSCDAV